MKIHLVCSPAPRVVHELALELQTGSAVGDALALSGWPVQFPEMKAQRWRLSIWGRTAGEQTVLREGDRLEICRPLRVDPKVARRERFAGQGARGTGLFSQRRPGSKAGY